MDQRILAVILFIFSLPLFTILFLLVKLTSKGPFLFTQKRAGKNRVPFIIYKIRSMKQNAEKMQSKYLYLNEADGPVFKIRHDPRYTFFGKFLSKTGLDELPQLINVIKGEMSFVGPRPLPINETNKIPNQYIKRFSVLPGITSLWVVKGAHKLSFKEWMELDVEYVRKKSFLFDLKVGLLTIKLILYSIVKIFK
jgi:lipopolysaccharide/colanic/teichoic acid biosynthesis glycosyltransferase